MTITYQRETWDKGIGEIARMAPEHWREFSYFPDAAPMEIDWAMYRKYDLSGALHCLSARRDGRIVGYHPHVVRRHNHRKPDVLFSQDLVLYVAPGPNRVLLLDGLIRYSLDYLQRIGVKVITVRSKLDHDIGPLLRHRGLQPLEATWGMVIP